MSNNKSLKLLFLYNSIFCFAGGLLGPLYAVFVEGIDDKIIWVSVSWATSLISTTLFVYILSKIGDRFNDKNLLLIGYVVRAIAWSLFLFVNSIPLLIFNMFLIGIGEAFGTPSFNAVFAEHLDDGQHIAEYSDWTLIANITIAASTIAGGIVVEKYGFQPLFVFMTILALISTIGLLTNGSVLDQFHGKKRHKKSLIFKS